MSFEKVEVGQYLRRAQAEDRALVILAMGLPYWIVPLDGLYALLVYEQDAPSVHAELESYEKEKRETQKALPPPKPLYRSSLFALFCYAWAMGIAFLIQQKAPGWWLDQGTADAQAIAHGQWWRSITALTLHADLGHLLANITVGVIFGAALLPWIGTGWAALGFILSGTLGNLLNAWAYHSTPHRSIGASTAVFGGLGLLVGWQTWALIRHHRESQRLRHRELFLPLGAGICLFAYLGVGEEGGRVDIMAHLFGLIAGIALGLLIGWGRLAQRTPRHLQKYLILLALLLPCLAWALAARAR